MKAENQHVAFLREIVHLQRAASIDAPHLRGVLETIDQLRDALAGLVAFRDRKGDFENLTDAELKPLLDAAFAVARKALGHQTSDNFSPKGD